MLPSIIIAKYAADADTVATTDVIADAYADTDAHADAVADAYHNDNESVLHSGSNISKNKIHLPTLGVDDYIITYLRMKFCTNDALSHKEHQENFLLSAFNPLNRSSLSACALPAKCSLSCSGEVNCFLQILQ